MLLIAAIRWCQASALLINANLLHPSIPRPLILWFHAAGIHWLGGFLYLSVGAGADASPCSGIVSLGWFGAALGSGDGALGITISHRDEGR